MTESEGGRNMNRRVMFWVAVVAFICIVLAGTLYFTPKSAPASAKEFTLVIANNALASGPSLITVNQDDTVTLHIQSDRGGHVEVHGYEKEIEVGGGGEATLTFVADKSGRFDIHLHGGGDHIEL